MNRSRHNLSFKIPNVKLRPASAAVAGSKRRRDEDEENGISAMDQEILDRAWEGAEDDDTSTAGLRNATKPWKGVVITFTGVEEKPALSKLAQQLGASIESALTVTVTHVVASGYGSAKYLYAVENRIAVMAPSWIAASHAEWLKGKDLDVQRDVESHRLAPFIGLRIAISGIEPLDRRKQLMNYVNEMGGIYSKDLDRNCTHLVSPRPANDKPSEKIKWALNEIAARAAKGRAGKKVEGEDIKLVYEEWIWDCVAYRGRWKEDYYDIRKARRNGRVNPDDVINGVLVLDSEEQAVPPADPTAAENEPALVKKRKREGMPTLVDELISVTKIKGEPSTSVETLEQKPSIAAETEIKEDSTRSETNTQQVEKKPSLLHVSRSTSFAAKSKIEASDIKPNVNPASLTAANNDMTASTVPSLANKSADEKKNGVVASSVTVNAKIFDGIKFGHIVGDQRELLEKALLDHGGILVSEESRRQGEEVDFVVMRLQSSIRPWLPDHGKIPQVVTECWVEGCFFEQKLLSPDKHMVFRPLDIAAPLPDAAKMLVHLTGFSTENTAYLRRLMKILGFTQSQSLNRKTTTLVCAASTGLKYEKAHEWGISVVKDTWLYSAARSGQIGNENEHRHTPHPNTDTSLTRGDTAESSKLAIGNMSYMSDLGSDIIASSSLKAQARSPAKSPARHKHLIQQKDHSQSSISPSRMLKLTPTHIDELATTANLVNDTRTSIPSIPTKEMPLSPPRAEAARRLNTISTPERQRNIDGLIRNASAPAQPESAERKKALADKDGRSSMIDALKMMAENGDRSGEERKSKPRRSRPGSRIKSTISISPSAASITRSTSPDPPEAVQAHAIPKSKRDVFQMDGGDESIMVKYIDSAAEKEKKRLKDALNRNRA